MLPITRANLQSFCRNCLREFTATETTHNIEQTTITNTQMANRLLPQKVCHCCFIKIKTLKGFQDRANLATGVLKLIVEERFDGEKSNEELKELERRLQLFCRLCLKLNTTKSNENKTEHEIFNDIKDCTGLQIDSNTKKCDHDKTPLADDVRFSHAICVRCITTLNSFVEYRKVAKQTIDYLQSILDDDDENEDFEAEISSPVQIRDQNTFDSKFVVDVVQNQSIDLLSEQEGCDLFTSNYVSQTAPKVKRKKNWKCRENNIISKNTKAGRKRKNQSVEVITADCVNEERAFLETIFSNRDDELVVEPNSEIADYDFFKEPINFIEAKVETAAERTELGENEALSKTETIEEDLMKNEFIADVEEQVAVMKEIEKTFKENENPLKRANSLEVSDAVKEETDAESEERYEPDDDLDFADSDISSDDISLAELKQKTKGNSFKQSVGRKTKRQTLKSVAAKNAPKAQYQCDKCQRKFFKKHTIEAHLKRHEGASKAFACYQCGKAFTTYQALQNHIDVHSGEGATRTRRPNYKSSRECPNCHLMLKRHIDLTEHIRKEHNGICVFKCKICGKCLSTLAALNRHELNHSDERPFACEFCEKRYNYETELKVHMQRHTSDPSLLCPICKTARANPEELQQHIASHRKPHQCFKCGKVFTKAYSLHQHDLSVHRNLRVHKCPDCDMSFKGRKTLTLHRLHHDPTGRPEKCRVCGLFFRTKRGRLRHTSKFHPNAELPPEEPTPSSIEDGRNECCEKCPLRFKTKRGLMLHTKKSHEKGQRIAKTEDELRQKYGDRSEICELCQLQCYSKKGLSRHIRKSHPDLAAVKDQQKTANCAEACNFCPLKFKTARGLIHHLKRMHREHTISNTQNQEELKDLTPVVVDEQPKLSLPLNWIGLE